MINTGTRRFEGAVLRETLDKYLMRAFHAKSLISVAPLCNFVVDPRPPVEISLNGHVSFLDYSNHSMVWLRTVKPPNSGHPRQSTNNDKTAAAQRLDVRGSVCPLGSRLVLRRDGPYYYYTHYILVGFRIQRENGDLNLFNSFNNHDE